MNNDYLTKCPCGRTTSKAFARAHNGRCKPCATEMVTKQKESPEEYHTRMITDHGYDAYAREEGRQ